MMAKLFDEREQNIIHKFYKELFSWSAADVGYKIVAGIFLFFHGCFMAFPYEDIKDFEILLVQCFAYMGYLMYITPYLQFVEKGKVTKLKEKLKYLPISRKQLLLYRLRKLLVFSLKLFAVYLLLQLFFTLVIYHKLTLGSFLYPLLCGFVFPVGVSSLFLVFENAEVYEFACSIN